MADQTAAAAASGNGGLLGAPAAPRGPRRSPTTGHVRRRVQTPDPPKAARSTRSEGRPDDDTATTTTEDSEDGRGAAGARHHGNKRTLGRSNAAKRSQSQPSPGEEGQRVSTSEDDDDYWHKYFAIQSKNIAKHNGSSLAAAAAGVLRPAPARPEKDRSPRRKSGAGDSTISRKSTSEKERALSERRPSAPNFSSVQDGEPLPPTPKPTLRRRAARSKSKGPPEEPATPPSPAANAESASETSSTASKTSKADKSIIWKKWSQAPEPSRKEVLSIDPAEVLRGLVPEDALRPEPEPESQPEPEAASLKPETNGDGGWFSWSRKSSDRSSKGKQDAEEKARQATPVQEEEKQAVEVTRKSSLRKERPRKGSRASTAETAADKSPLPAEPAPVPAPSTPKQSWLGRLFGRKPAPGPTAAPPPQPAAARQPPPVKVNWLAVARDIRAEWRAFRQSHPDECRRLRLMAHRCAAALLLMLLYCGLGGLLFRFIEGSFESFYKCGVKRVKRDFIDALWTTSHNLREDEWKSRARRRLWEFEEQLHAAHEAGVTSYSGIKSWTFLNAVVYCLTVVTTIGYGHISPSTNTGRAVTIIYAIFGIPMFLILLADFGKLFTRGIKFVWSFVRRLYYTGSCRKVRRTQPVQEIMKGAQMVYDLATFRRPSMFPQGEAEVDVEEADTPLRTEQAQPPTFRLEHPDSSEPPATPAPSAFEVDDEFNLPISVAIVILLIYLFVGASIYYIWESWGFFESFYFVFISMSTIGFGDFVPQHPMYMMASIVYLIFGLALTSMCINVVQEKLSDSFRQASAKIGATIGLRIAEEEAASTNPGTPGNGPAEGQGEDLHAHPPAHAAGEVKS
ncbi:TWiK family of potassium channels protein 18 [Frankliniella fusca]|uniref:TWiK family of potassium channels protein 18 n=1 Tax=Frankliniella fusca TaxID=407009 RepID=A0AAE1H0S1_9NEOP|nr:TWiK family of potassium channels protein 18 [Frankliniella fusca]